MYHLSTFFVCFVVLIFMNSESVASLFVANPRFIYRPEGSNADMSCESADLYHQWNQGYEKDAIYLGVINTMSNIIVTHGTTSVSVNKHFNSTHNGTTVLCCIYYDVNGTDDEKWINRYVVKKTMLIYGDNTWNDALNCDEGNQAILIYVTTAVSVIFILLVVIAFCKKRFRKEPKSDTKLLYVDLDILRTEPVTFQRPRPEDDPSYAQIIGVIRSETH